MMLRAAVNRTRSPVLVLRRSLGDTTRGPGAANLSLTVNKKFATEFFTKGAVSYGEYKQQCQSLRVFAFIAAAAFPVIALAINPPKSSYWATFSPGYWLGNARGGIFPAKTSIFLTDKVERETDVKEVHEHLVMWRRLPGSGEDEE